MPVKYIAFFDLDGTIISTYSATAIVRKAISNGMMGRGAVLKAIYLSMLYRLRLRDELKTVLEMMLWLKGAPENTILELVQNVCSDVLIPAIRPEAVAEMGFHRKQNAGLVLLSSALKPVCSCIAEYLEMDDVICSDPEVRNGFFTGQTTGLMCNGEEKARRMRAYCQEKKTEISETWYYGDSYADRHVLGIAGNPVCINPDKNLRKMAEEKNWEIKSWR